jgi:hypothetical protein
VLILPKASRSFVVFCDASKICLDGVLMQDGRVVANASRQLRIHERTFFGSRFRISSYGNCI